MRNLSPTQFETLQKMEENGKLIRWNGGFWSFEDAEIKDVIRDSWGYTSIPQWYCDVRTLRALEKKAQ